MKQLNIVHVDMDAFFAAVEKLDNPALQDKPVIVGGVSIGQRGVVATASYEAREFGIHSAMPIAKAKILCPDGIYLPTRKDRYQQVSKQFFSILNSFTPLVEKISIDEAFLDLTGCHKLFGSSEEIAKKIKEKINMETGLTASVGLAPNKFLAKIASDLKKPAGLTIVRPEEVEEFLEKLPVGKLWGVGIKLEKKLKNLGIEEIGDIQQFSLQKLNDLFGRSGVKLFYLSRGIDNRKVNTENSIKSISHEETFSKDIFKKDEIYAVLMQLAEKVSYRLRSNDLAGNTVFVKVRYADFKTYTRRITLKKSVSRPEEVYQIGKRLLKINKLLKKPVRLLGIGVSKLAPLQKKQLNLFDKQKEKKQDQLVNVIDDLNNKYGFQSVQRARELLLNDDLSQ